MQPLRWSRSVTDINYLMINTILFDVPISVKNGVLQGLPDDRSSQTRKKWEYQSLKLNQMCRNRISQCEIVSPSVKSFQPVRNRFFQEQSGGPPPDLPAAYRQSPSHHPSHRRITRLGCAPSVPSDYIPDEAGRRIGRPHPDGILIASCTIAYTAWQVPHS